MRGSRMKWQGLALAAALLAATAASAQGPGSGRGMGPGMGPGMGQDMGPGFGEHQPPMERAFGPGGDHGRWWNNPRVVARLKLTDAQRSEFDAILLAHREKLIDLRASLEKAELELEPMVREDQPNETQILAQIDKVAQARAELEKANARFLLAIRAKLTPEQWKLVQERWNDRGERHGDWGHGRQGMGGHMRPMPAAPQGPENAPPPPAGDTQQ